MRLGILGRALRIRGKRLIPGLTVCLLVIVLLLSFFGLRARAAPLALPIFASVAESRVQSLVREVARELEAESTYGDICTLNYAADGSIQGLWVNSEAVNRLTADLAEELESRLAGITLTCEIKSGDILFPRLFSGSGIPLTVRGSLYGGASAQPVSSLSEGGLNQTLHRLEVEVTVPLTLTVLGEEEQLTVTSRVLLGETVIVGSMPGGIVVGG